MLQTWVKEDENRNDEYSLQRHELIFSAFQGQKREHGQEDIPQTKKMNKALSDKLAAMAKCMALCE